MGWVDEPSVSDRAAGEVSLRSDSGENDPRWASRTQVQGELMISVVIGVLREMCHREFFVGEAEKITFSVIPLEVDP